MVGRSLLKFGYKTLSALDISAEMLAEAKKHDIYSRDYIQASLTETLDTIQVFKVSPKILLCELILKYEILQNEKKKKER